MKFLILFCAIILTVRCQEGRDDETEEHEDDIGERADIPSNFLDCLDYDRNSNGRCCGAKRKPGRNNEITDDGITAEPGEMPWVVNIIRPNKAPRYNCTGALIGPTVVVTTAHCVYQQTPQSLKVRGGEWNIGTENEIMRSKDSVVQKVIIHPEYYRAGFYNNIALLILEEPMTLDVNIDNICLPDNKEAYKSDKCFIVGWGPNQQILHKIAVPIMPMDKCKAEADKQGYNLHEPSHMCAGGQSERTICRDHSSLLICPNGSGNSHSLAGVTTNRVNCRKDNIPTVFTDVAAFNEWIFNEESVKEQNIAEYHKLPDKTN